MECTVYGRALTREQGVAFAESLQVAEEIDGRLVPKVEAHITTQDDGWSVGSWSGDGESAVYTPKSGWFFNVRYYGNAAAMLAEGGNPNGATVFERFPGLVGLTQLRTGEPMVWASLGGDVPQGYECAAYGVRLYDANAVATPANVIA